MSSFQTGGLNPATYLRGISAPASLRWAYVGETIRRQGEGRWLASQGDPEDVINLTVKLKSGSIFWPMQRIIKRLQNGSEDGIYVYGAGILNRLSSSTGSLPSNDQRE
jgi:hypothetical protein